MDPSSILKGIVYSRFGQIGPEPCLWYPKEAFDSTFLSLISLKTITLLQGEEGYLPEEVAVVPFPKNHLNSIVNFFAVKDPEARGGEIDSTLTIMFSEKYSSVIYKYLELFQEQIDVVSKKLIENEMAKDTGATQALLQQFYNSLVENLKSLKQAESREEEIPEIPRYKFKICVFGDPAVGKTTLLLKYVDNCFREIYIPTVGVNVSTKSISVKAKGGEKASINLNLWDLAGQANFKTLRKIYAEGSSASIIIYDCTRSETFSSVKKWKDEIEKINPKIPVYLLGNKIDLKEKRKVSTDEGKDIASTLGLKYFETSAKTGENVSTLFEDICLSIIEKS